jgi:hypothetical protein
LCHNLAQYFGPIALDSLLRLLLVEALAMLEVLDLVVMVVLANHIPTFFVSSNCLARNLFFD